MTNDYQASQAIKELQDRVKELEQRMGVIEVMHDVAKGCEDPPQISVSRDES